MLARDEDILKAAEDWRKAGRGVALATVVETWGSAPRPVGSNLVIDDQGNFLGSVSGGCVEGAVVTEAIDVIESGKPKTLEFGVADETAWKVGLSCGGTIRVFVEKVDSERLSCDSRSSFAKRLNRHERAARARARRRRHRVRRAARSGWSRRPTSRAIRSRTLLENASAQRQERHGGDAARARSSSPCTCRRRSSSSPARCISARRWRRWRSCSATT